MVLVLDACGYGMAGVFGISIVWLLVRIAVMAYITKSSVSSIVIPTSSNHLPCPSRLCITKVVEQMKMNIGRSLIGAPACIVR